MTSSPDKSAPARTSSPGRRRRFRKLLLGSVVCLLLLVVGVAVLVPMVAGSILIPRIEAAARDSINGSLNIDSLSVSWTGSQTAHGVQLLTPDGTAVAEVDLTIDRSLLGLISGWQNLGTVRVTGWAEIEKPTPSAPTNLERAIEPRTVAQPSPPRTEPLSLPALEMTLDLRDLRFGYTINGERIGITDLTVSGPLSLAGNTKLTITALPVFNEVTVANQSINIDVQSGPVIDANRRLKLHGSGLRFNLSALIPSGIANTFMNSDIWTDRYPTDPIGIAVSIKEENGRLVPWMLNDAIMIEGDIPPSLIARLAPLGALTTDVSPRFELRSTAFDLPIALATDGLARADLTNSAILFTLESSATDAVLTSEDGTQRTLRIEPVDLRIGSENLSQQAFAQGDIRALVDGTPALTALLDVRIDNLLTTAGAIAPIDQVRPRGELRLVDAPSSVLDPIAARIDALGPGFASAVFGNSLTLTLTADARADLGSADTSIESPRIGLDLESPKTTLRANAVFDGDRLEAPGEFLTLTSTAGRELLARFAPQLLEPMQEGDRPIRLTASAEDLRLIQGSDLPFDLDRIEGSVRMSIDRESATTIGLDRIVLSVDSAGDASTRVNAIAVGNRAASTDDGSPEPFNLTADLNLTGLNALATSDDPLRAPGFTADGSVNLTGIPLTMAEQLAGLEQGTITRILDQTLSGRIALSSNGSVNTAQISLGTPAADLQAGLRLEGTTLSAASPITISSREPQRLLSGLAPGGIRIGDRQILGIRGPSEFSATVEGINLDLDQLDDPQAVASSFSSAVVAAPGLEFIDENGRRLTYDRFQLQIVPVGNALRADLTGASDADTILSVQTTLPVQPLLDGAEPFTLIAEAQKTLTANASLPPWLAGAFAGERAPLVTAALQNQPIRLSIEPAQTGSRLELTTGQSLVRTAAAVSSQAISIARTEATITASPDQLRSILNTLNTEDPAPTIGLASATTLDIVAEPFAIPLGSEDGFDLTGMRASATLRDRAIITGVLERDGSPRDLGVRNASARVAFSEAGPTLEASAQAFDPQRPDTALGSLTASVQPEGRFDVRLAEARPRALDTWLAGAATQQGPFALTFGDSLTLRAQTRTVAGLPAGTDRIEVAVESPRVTTQLLANRSPERIELAEPFQAAWTVAPDLFNDLVSPLIADADGSELRLREAAPAAVAVRSLVIERTEDGYDFPGMRINAEFGMVNANFDALLGETDATQIQRPVELGKVQGSVIRDSAQAPLRFTLTSLDNQTNNERFSVEGTLDTTGPSPVVTAAAQGDIPTALLDALAGQRGLLVGATGDTVRVQASADDIAADRSQGKLTATLQAARLEAAAFGRFEDGSLILGDGAASRTNITLSEITPELSRRVFEPLFPLLKDFRKSRDEAPTMITVTRDSLAIPTDGDLSKLNGSINLNLGSVRFEAGDLLGAVLSATDNRAAGQLGRSVPPVLVNFNNGVANYDKVDIPFGDVVLSTRGSIDLVNRRMDIIVLIPLQTLSGDIRRAAERNPIVGQLAAVPFRARGEFGEAKLELDPAAIQDLVPGAIEQQLNDLINQGLRDLFRR